MKNYILYSLSTLIICSPLIAENGSDFNPHKHDRPLHNESKEEFSIRVQRQLREEEERRKERERQEYRREHPQPGFINHREEEKKQFLWRFGVLVFSFVAGWRIWHYLEGKRQTEDTSKNTDTAAQAQTTESGTDTPASNGDTPKE